MTIRTFICCLAAASLVHAAHADLAVVSVSPDRHAITAPPTSSIVIDFDQPVDPDTVTPSSFSAFGRWSGSVIGTYAFSNSNQTVTLVPNEPFQHGETVMVVLSHDIAGEDGETLRSAGYSFTFWTASRPALLEFEELDVLSTRSDPNEETIAYGGIASDLNGDRWLDLTIVNEATADLRVFMNTGDGQGTFNDFTKPTYPVGLQASPSEPADFNGDGNVDICVANIAASTVSILHGNGDGTFAPQQLIDVGATPRGIAVLDVDGDGDVDIANTNNGSGNLSLLINYGNGVFSDPIFFESGTVGEWAISAADMNDDGILDLVVGGRQNEEVVIQLGNGDGTFTFSDSESCEGGVWMMGVGDVNGDGAEDVVTVNSFDDTGAILFGDGAGGLTLAQTYPTDSFSLATDLADMDGDGDLDWITSSFFGDWFFYLNNGDGTFTFQQEFPASGASSCSLPMDIDNDGDLDLALIDEVDDLVTIMKNTGTSEQAPLDDLDVVHGSLLDGSLTDLEVSDSNEVHTRSSPGFFASEPNVMDMVVGSTNALDVPAALDLTIESHINHPVGVAKVRLHNWNTGQFDEITQTDLSMDETIEHVMDVNATDYVRAGDDRVETSLRHVVIAVFAASGFDSFFDRVEVFGR